MFPVVPSHPDFFQLQSEVLEYRKKNKIFEKSISNREGAENFTLFDGPPFKNGSPHYGSLLQSAVKDAIPRFWTMKGKKVPRTRGRDCHGIYIEQKVQKALGLPTNQAIEDFGIEQFIQECYKFTNAQNDEWNWIIPNFGRRVDMENAYETMSANYMESVRHIFKTIYDQGKIYKGKRVSLYSTKLNTAIGNFEVQADNSYAEINDPAITVKFKVQNKNNLTASPFETTEDGAIKVVSALIKKDNTYLGLYHGKKGGLQIPGGKVDTGETNEVAMMREIKEELGVESKVGKLLFNRQVVIDNNYFDHYAYEVEIYGDPLMQELHKHDSMVYFEIIHDESLPIGWGIKIDDIIISDPSELLTTYNTQNIVYILESGKADLFQFDRPIYFLARTTTPWTIPANLALVVHPTLDYAQIWDIKTQEYYILAHDLLSKYYKNPDEYILIYVCKGSDLVGIGYVPPFDYYTTDKLSTNQSDSLISLDHSFKVYTADYVTATDGTGIVHTAPEFGEDDYQTGKKYDLYQTNSLDAEGRYTSEIDDMIGLYYRKDDDTVAAGVSNANDEVMRRLTDSGLLFRKESITHTVALCPRTQTPLIYKTQDSRFIDTHSIKPQLLAQNEHINRTPASVKYNRFAKSIETAPDRCISRTKYWATPMPVWTVTYFDSGKIKTDTKVMGSREDIYALDQTGSKILDRKMGDDGSYTYIDAKTKSVFDFHRPYIDSIWGQEGGRKYMRTPEVLDPWMDSGSMPFAQLHYPFENADKFAAGFPADFIGEAEGQIRCWFQMMHTISVLMTGQNAYKNVICTGTILGNDGRKMSKSYGNYPDIRPSIQSYGADAIRMSLFNSSVLSGGSVAINEEVFKEVLRKIHLPLRNAYAFFTTYANIDQFVPTKHSIHDFQGFVFTNDLDEWIISKLALLIDAVHTAMLAYDIQSAVRPIILFIEDLTNRYIRRNRRRFWKSENDSEKMSGYDVLYVVLVELCKVLSPFMPFLSEHIYRNLTGHESVHLTDRTE